MLLGRKATNEETFTPSSQSRIVFPKTDGDEHRGYPRMTYACTGMMSECARTRARVCICGRVNPRARVCA